MSRGVALTLVLVTCMVLAGLLLFDAITPLVSGSVFAVALVIFGGLSRGFRGR